VLAQIADLIIEAYACESANRARRETRGARRRPHGDRRRHREGLRQRCGGQGLGGDAADRGGAGVARRHRNRSTRVAGHSRAHGGIDAIAARRRIADAVIEAGKYPL